MKNFYPNEFIYNEIVKEFSNISLDFIKEKESSVRCADNIIVNILRLNFDMLARQAIDNIKAKYNFETLYVLLRVTYRNKLMRNAFDKIISYHEQITNGEINEKYIIK